MKLGGACSTEPADSPRLLPGASVADGLTESSRCGVITPTFMHVIEVVSVVLTAFGTVAVAVLAIWGEFFRYKLAGPQLVLSLHDSRGDLTARTDGTQAYFFHLKVRNRRLWSPARDVRVLLERIARRRPDGTFLTEHLVYPLPLIWTPMEMGDFLRTVGDVETCDLGFLDQTSDRFRLSTFLMPHNLHGYVARGGAIRIGVVATGQNVTSSTPLLLEIAWDGVWVADRQQMLQHLVVKEIASFA